MGCLLMQLSVWYSHIIFSISMPVIYPWCSRVIGWVSTQPCILYSLDTLQISPSWGCLSLGLINHLLCLILGVQLLYPLIGYCFIQFQCAVVNIRHFFLLHCPILGSVLNLLLSTVRAFQFRSYGSLDTSICIHCLLQNYTVLLIIRLSVDISQWKPICFLAYGFPMLFLFHVQFRFIVSASMSPHWFIKQFFYCFIHYLLEFSDEFQSVSSLAGFWQIFFIIQFFLITFVFLRWLICCLLLSYSFSTLTWNSCQFASLSWWTSRDLFPCVWWNFFHSPFFHYSFCNIPDALWVWCLPSKFPYCFCIASWCDIFCFFFCFPLFTTICCVFACYCMFGHTSLYAAIDWFITNTGNVFQSMS